MLLLLLLLLLLLRPPLLPLKPQPPMAPQVTLYSITYFIMTSTQPYAHDALPSQQHHNLSSLLLPVALAPLPSTSASPSSPPPPSVPVIHTSHQP
jgi:hypothetical protein